MEYQAKNATKCDPPALVVNKVRNPTNSAIAQFSCLNFGPKKVSVAEAGEKVERLIFGNEEIGQMNKNTLSGREVQPIP